MSTEARYAIGLDVGGTKIAAGLVDVDAGEIVVRRLLPTAAGRGGAAVLADCVQLAQELHAEAVNLGLPLLGIGVGIAEMVDRDGRLTSHETIDWRGLSPLDSLEAVAPALIDSDARAGALAEAKYGRGRAYAHSFLYVTVGTGISYALVAGGAPWVGARGNAIVLANSPMVPMCHECGQRSGQTLEAFAAGPALVRRYCAAGGIALRGHDVLAAVMAGDERAAGVVRSAASALGVAVGGLVNALDPEAVIAGGGLGTAPGLYWETFVASVREYVWAENTRGLPIEQSGLGVDTGLLGAAALTLRL